MDRSVSTPSDTPQPFERLLRDKRAQESGSGRGFTLAVDDVELGLIEGRRGIVLPRLDANAIAESSR
jgi:hypothetical protein